MCTENRPTFTMKVYKNKASKACVLKFTNYNLDQFDENKFPSISSLPLKDVFYIPNRYNNKGGINFKKLALFISYFFFINLRIQHVLLLCKREKYVDFSDR